jgi:16S rRNA (cytidine1402-2'-O)-methyltransferase
MAKENREGGAGRSYFVRGTAFDAPALPPGLHLVATPIGNLGDITLRALDTLAAADFIACEDTRVTRKLLSRYGIKASITTYHEHSGPAAHRWLLEKLAEGRSVALVSDAGTPLISDPGALLVADALAAGHPVTPIPGPSSVIAALAVAGLPAEPFLYLGFLPAKENARRKRLAEVRRIPATLVLFESPNRISALLADAAAELGKERAAAVCRELTKLHETTYRGSLAELAERFSSGEAKGEIVVLVAPPEKEETPAVADVDALLTDAIAAAGVKEGAALVAKATGLSARDLYRRALELKKSR